MRVTQSVTAVRRATRPLDPRLGGGRRARAAARPRGRRADRAPDRPPHGSARGGRRAARPWRPLHARAGRGLGRAAGPREHVQRDGRAARAARREPAGVRRRRLAPAPHAAGGVAAAARGGAERPGTRRRSRARSRRSTGCRRWCPSCCCSRRPARSTRPAEEIDLGAAAHRAAARFDERVSALSGAPTPPVHCAPADLERTLDALVENALHYGGGTVTLVARPGAIDVLDDGPGIDPAGARGGVRALPPRQGRPRRPARTGLGLPIARELMRRWGGDVTLANREGGGAAATISFDRA